MEGFMDRVFLPAATAFWLGGVPLLIGCGKNGTAPPAPPARIAIQAGDNQQAPVGTAVPTAPAVTVSDQYGHPVSNVSVTFAVAAGQGSITGGNATTSTSGVATVGTWRLGPALGTNTLTATASGAGIAGNPATFTALGTGCTNCWSTKAPMPTPRERLATDHVYGILYAVGGDHPPVGAVATVEAYDPSTDTWATKASMPTARTGLGVTAINGILYAVGGANAGGSLATLEAYDSTTNTWTTKASMPTARDGLSVTAINGFLYAVGGQNSQSGLVLTTVEAYDPTTNTWTTKAPMPTSRSGLGVTAINGILYAVGGSHAAVGDEATVEAYDPGTDTWSTKASMPAPRAGLGVTAINSVLYAVGGYSFSLGNIYAVATVEGYDPAANTWTTKASLPAARAYLATTAIYGLLYAVGGEASSGSVATGYQP